MTSLQERFKETIIGQYATNPNNINELSIACEKITEEFAEAFYTWCIDKVHFIDSDGLNVMIENSERITHKQLLQQFKEERK